MDVSDNFCDNCWAHRYTLNMGYGYDGLSKVAGCGGFGGDFMGCSLGGSEFYQDEWIHAVGTVDMDSGTASLYIDGEFIGEQPISSTEDFIQLGLGNEQSKIIGREALWYRQQGIYRLRG